MKVSREFKVGFIAIIALVLFYWGLNFLKGKDLFQNEKIFYAVYEQVDGLSRSRPINVNGFQIGNIQDIYFHPDNSGRLLVKMNITNDFVIPKNSLAKIYSQDLLGGKSIELVIGDSPNPAVNGDTLKSKIELSLTEEVNRQVAPIKEKAEKLIGSIDTVLILVSGFLNEDTKNNFTKTFSSLQRSFSHLESTVGTIDESMTASQGDFESIIKNLASVTSNLKDNNEELSAIFSNIENITDSLAQANLKQTLTSLSNALAAAENIMRKIDEGEGSAGKLINDPELYNNLEQASDQLDALLKDVRYNPKRYINVSVFGGGSKKKVSTEEIIEKEKERKAIEAKHEQ